MPDSYREPIEDKPEALKELEQMPSGPEAKELPATPEKPSPAPSQEQAQLSASPVSLSSSQSAAAVPTQGTDLENDRQLKILVDLAFQKGIDAAVEAAKASEDPYLIDKFHDTLVDELRQQLIEKKKLKEV